MNKTDSVRRPAHWTYLPRQAAEILKLDDYPVRWLLLSLRLLALPLPVASQTSLEIVAMEISEILCEDPDYLSCVHLEASACASSIKAFSMGCSHVFKIISSDEAVEFQLRREITNCLIKSHVESLSLERNRVESCYLERQGG